MRHNLRLLRPLPKEFHGKESIVNKVHVLLIGCLLLLAPAGVQAFPPDKTGNCLDCHKLEKKDAEDIIKKLLPAATVTDVKMAPVKGFWVIEVEMNGQRGGIYLDFTKKYLTSQLVPLEFAIRQAEQQAKPQKVDFSKVSLKDAVVLGAKNPKKKVAVFTDPDCPYCRKLHEEMKQVIAKRKDIAFYLLLFPLPMHKEAYPKAQAALCEKSLTLVDDAFSGKTVPEPKCSNEALERVIVMGRELNVNGTPTLIREDGTLMSGTMPADKLIEWIDGK
jgi:thiol:disulfide interchange protein DsbC